MNLILWIKNKNELEQELISLERELNITRSNYTKSKSNVHNLELIIDKLTNKIIRQKNTIKNLKKELKDLNTEKKYEKKYK